MTRPTIPARSFYSIAELAKLWDMDPDQIELLSLDGLKVLSIELYEGNAVRGVAFEEVHCFEAERFKSDKRPAEMRGDAKRNLLIFAGLMGCHNQGEDAAKVTAARLLAYAGNLTDSGNLGSFVSDSWVEKTLREMRSVMASEGCDWFSADEPSIAQSNKGRAISRGGPSCKPSRSSAPK